jgi:hypothetical protein
VAACVLSQPSFCCVAGKSTLLNALIGANCLPANNVPETARITRITHTQGPAELVDNAAEQPKLVTGEEDIKAYLRYLNSEARTRDHLLSDEKYLDLKIPIAALQASNDVTAAAQNVTIRLLDTPGPNEAGEVALKAQVSLPSTCSLRQAEMLYLGTSPKLEKANA